MRLLSRMLGTRNDVVLQGFEGWRGLIFGSPKINPLQPTLKTVKAVIASKAKQSLKKKVFSGQ
jgi:hypothetical protein